MDSPRGARTHTRLRERSKTRPGVRCVGRAWLGRVVGHCKVDLWRLLTFWNDVIGHADHRQHLPLQLDRDQLAFQAVLFVAHVASNTLLASQCS